MRRCRNRLVPLLVLLPMLAGQAAAFEPAAFEPAASESAATSPCRRPAFDLPIAGQAPSSVEELRQQRGQVELFRACLQARREAASALNPPAEREIVGQIEAVDLVDYTLGLFIVALQRLPGD